MTAWKQAVARAFDRADAYEDAARIQAIVAENLAGTVAAETLPPLPTTLEVGCGTGLLTRALRRRIRTGPMLATDVAPTMLARCRAGLPASGDVRFAAMDGERPAVGPGWDLIVSSLAAQWFVDLDGALGRLAALLNPGGLLAVTTLAAGTFREWDEARAVSAGERAASAYPSIASLRTLSFDGCATEIRLDHVHEPHVDGAAFLRALRAIGAHTPSQRAAVGSAGELRRALRAFDEGGASITYAVATCLIRRDGGGARTASSL